MERIGQHRRSAGHDDAHHHQRRRPAHRHPGDGTAGGDRTTVEFAALLTEALGGYRIPPQYRSPVASIA